jgi:flagellar basal body-associated protein FliL
VQTPTPVVEQPPQPQITTPTPKKSNKKMYVIVAVIVAVVVIALISYFVLANTKSTVKPADTGKGGTGTAKSVTDSSTVGSMTSILTNNVTSESNTTNTNDSSLASDASSAVGNVGDSVNENNIK